MVSADPLLGAQMDNFHRILDTGKMVDNMVGAKPLSSMDRLKKVCLSEVSLQIKLHLRSLMMILQTLMKISSSTWTDS